MLFRLGMGGNVWAIVALRGGWGRKFIQVADGRVYDSPVVPGWLGISALITLLYCLFAEWLCFLC